VPGYRARGCAGSPGGREWTVKTARRYVEAAAAAGLCRDGEEGQLSDELLGQVAEAVRPARPGGHGAAWDALEACQEQVAQWVKDGLSVVKIGVLLERRRCGCRTGRCTGSARSGAGSRRTASTVPVADGEPGAECQLGFGYMGMLPDPVAGRRRKVHALIFTAARSLYSAPREYLGRRLDVRADSALVKLFHRGVLVKVHLRVGPGLRLPLAVLTERRHRVLRQGQGPPRLLRLGITVQPDRTPHRDARRYRHPRIRVDVQVDVIPAQRPGLPWSGSTASEPACSASGLRRVRSGPAAGRFRSASSLVGAGPHVTGQFSPPARPVPHPPSRPRPWPPCRKPRSSTRRQSRPRAS
jgi:hypothetical protein